MQAATKFERWDFLESHFSSIEASENKTEDEEEEEEEEKIQDDRLADCLRTSKLFQLSRLFPMFNDDAIPSPKLDNVVDYDFGCYG